jgi:nucleoside-diphosphate-sugar epimerase
MKVLVTGANGFIGSALCPYLARAGYEVVPVVRRRCGLPGEYVITGEEEWSSTLQGCDTVVHLAGRAHVMHESQSEPLRAFRVANVDASIALAHRAAVAGVRRLIFISTVKVNGEKTEPGRGFCEEDEPAPHDFYAASKWEAEQGLIDIARATGLEIVIIRIPIVYGPGVKGNFRALMNVIKARRPLPLGSVRNHRSFIALDNLLHFIALCANPEASPRAANEVFLLSDGISVSTTELLEKIASAYGYRARLFSVPVSWMRFGALLIGKGAVVSRLFDSLVIDDSKARKLLDWHSPSSMDEQLRKMANASDY